GAVMRKMGIVGGDHAVASLLQRLAEDVTDPEDVALALLEGGAAGGLVRLCAMCMIDADRSFVPIRPGGGTAKQTLQKTEGRRLRLAVEEGERVAYVGHLRFPFSLRTRFESLHRRDFKQIVLPIDVHVADRKRQGGHGDQLARLVEHAEHLIDGMAPFFADSFRQLGDLEGSLLRVDRRRCDRSVQQQKEDETHVTPSSLTRASL